MCFRFFFFCFVCIHLDLSRKMKSEQMMDNRFDLADIKCDVPIDLSRHCDSVETRKTPSPYNSSAFGGESSPSLLNESPNSLRRSNSNASHFDGTHNNRADTPNRYLPSSAYNQRNYSTASTTCNKSTKFPYESDRSLSPDEEMPLQQSHSDRLHHRYMTDQQLSMLNVSKEDLSIWQSIALQNLQNVPGTAHAIDSSAANDTIARDIRPFPMLLGRDGKMARPFKAYSSDPLSIAAAVPASDSFIHRFSAENFNVFREEMFKKIHEGNGGRPTITNPKMRRTSHRGSGTGDANTENDRINGMEFGKQYQQQQQQPNDASPQNKPQSVQADSNESNDTDRNGGGKDPIRDSAYFERRRKNNAAAKKSRDRRRIKEDEIAIRCAFLERENLELKYELASVKQQLAIFLKK